MQKSNSAQNQPPNLKQARRKIQRMHMETKRRVQRMRNDITTLEKIMHHTNFPRHEFGKIQVVLDHVDIHLHKTN